MPISLRFYFEILSTPPITWISLILESFKYFWTDAGILSFSSKIIGVLLICVIDPETKAST